MEGIQAIPMDVRDLISYYDKYHPEFETYFDKNVRQKNLQMKKKSRSRHGPPPSAITIYDLAEFFIKDQAKKEPKSHFVLDEIPMIQIGENSQPFIQFKVIRE